MRDDDSSHRHASGTVRVAVFHGIPIRVEWTFVVLFALVLWTLAEAALPELAPGYRPGEYWATALVVAAAFFAALLGHELSHSVVAQRAGIPVDDITLWLIGGVSRITREPTSASDELRIAIAGPIASVAVAGASFALAVVLAGLDAPKLAIAAALWLATISFFIALFNVVPAAPLDGGRILRAWLWRRHGDRNRATQSSAQAGRNFGHLLIGLGLLSVVFGNASGLWLVVLGWFILNAARAEEMQGRLMEATQGVLVRDVMSADPITIRDDRTVQEVLDHFVLVHHCTSFPVTDADGRPVGLATLQRIRRVPPGQRPTTAIGSVAWSMNDVAVAQPDEPIAGAIARAGGRGDGRILVCDGGRLVGIVTPSDTMRLLQVLDLAPV
jgi:Zn-dependent protease/CBS domain-containing protein